MPKFNGKIALVTGGTSGIGLAAVSLLRAEGAEVIAVGTNPERLAAVREIVANNGLVLEVDLRKLANIDGVIEAVSQKYGKLDIVYANAGLGLAAVLHRSEGGPSVGGGRQHRSHDLMAERSWHPGPVDRLGDESRRTLPDPVARR